MGNMKQLNEFLEELKKEKMENAIIDAKYFLDKNESRNAQRILIDTLKHLNTLQDKVTAFITITTDDAPTVLEPYNGEIIFMYKSQKFMITLDKTFNGKSSDIIHFWHITDDEPLQHIDWFYGSKELEKLVSTHLKVDKQKVNMIPIEYYIWSEFKSFLDSYLTQNNL